MKKLKKIASDTSIMGRAIRAMWIAFLSLALLFSLYVLSVRYNLFNLYGELPGYRELENPEAQNDLSSVLYTADGVILGKYYRYNRTQTSFDELSPALVNTLLCTEDVRFDRHSGIDPRGLLRVLVKNVLLGQRSAGGGSTLTQQLAKNLFRTREEELEGALQKLGIGGLNLIISKTKEWIVAIQLEKAFTKNEIMAMFLNTVLFGHNAYGIDVAARTFFNTTPSELSYTQSAMLVGMLNKPTRFSPIMNPENALNKRTEVLHNLYKYGHIDRVAFDSLKNQPLGIEYTPEDHVEGMAPYFRTAIRPELLQWAAENNFDLFESGLRIYTTIDSRMQQYAETAVAQHMEKLQDLFDVHWKGQNPWIDENGVEIPNFLENTIRRAPRYRELVARHGKNSDSVRIVLNTPYPMRVFTWEGDVDTLFSPMDSLRYYKNFLQAGFMAMDPLSGQIKAWVGGINYRYFQYDHVYQGRRQPGSTFKPFVYLAAIDNGYSPCYEVEDSPVTFQVPGQVPPTYTPQNYAKVFTGERMTIRQGMARSVNSITAFLMKMFTPETVVKYARELGVESPLDPVPALCLGTSDVSVYELVGAYSTFVNRGVYNKPHFITRIEDKYGNLIQEFPPKTREVLSEETAYLMTYMLRGGTEEDDGTGLGLSAAVRHGNEVGAKTGTTQNASDGWFIGLTKDLTAGAWVGGDDRSIHFRTSALGQGARTAMPIFDFFMQQVYADPALGYQKGPFPRPIRPLSVEIDCEKYKNPFLTEQDSLQSDQPPRQQLEQDDIF
jgi:penicillin-binding protein 1A